MIIDRDHKGCYAAAKANGKKYYFECGDMTSRKESMQKVIVDKIDDHKQKARIKRNQKMVAIEAEQKKQRDIVKAEIDRLNKEKPGKPDRPKKDNPGKPDKQKSN